MRPRVRVRGVIEEGQPWGETRMYGEYAEVPIYVKPPREIREILFDKCSAKYKIYEELEKRGLIVIVEVEVWVSKEEMSEICRRAEVKHNAYPVIVASEGEKDYHIIQYMALPVSPSRV